MLASAIDNIKADDILIEYIRHPKIIITKYNVDNNNNNNNNRNFYGIIKIHYEIIYVICIT